MTGKLMLRNLESFLSELFDNRRDEITSEEELRIASAALLIHCARADGIRSEAEYDLLKEILSAQYGLADEQIEHIVALAEDREHHAIDMHRFTRVLHQRLDRGGRQQMVKWLWQIANADGTIDRAERNTIALAASLLDVETRDSVALRQAATAPNNTDS